MIQERFAMGFCAKADIENAPESRCEIVVDGNALNGAVLAAEQLLGKTLEAFQSRHSINTATSYIAGPTHTVSVVEGNALYPEIEVWALKASDLTGGPFLKTVPIDVSLKGFDVEFTTLVVKTRRSHRPESALLISNQMPQNLQNR